jgi:hypothetical protein
MRLVAGVRERRWKGGLSFAPEASLKLTSHDRKSTDSGEFVDEAFQLWWPNIDLIGSACMSILLKFFVLSVRMLYDE